MPRPTDIIASYVGRKPVVANYVGRSGFGVLGLVIADANSYRGDTAAASMAIATYDGGNELVHPSVYDAGPAGWNGKRYWMAATPYAGSVVAIENPCIYCADSLDGPWVPPAGLTNPIAPAPGGAAFNSDTHLVWGRDGYLYCFYREFNPANVGSEERIKYRRSSDGVTWGADINSLVNDQAVRRLVSPAIEWDGARWVMYAVDIVPATNSVVRLTSNSLDGPWSTPQSATLSMPATREAWHLDAKYISGAWFLLVQDTPIGGSSGGALYLCKSTDGAVFTRPTEWAISPTGPWHSFNYRSCLVLKNNAGRLEFDLIYTGISNGTYHLGHTLIQQFDYAAYLAEPATAIAGAVSNTPPYLIGDNFTRADGAIGTSTGGEVWAVGAGAPVVAGNKAAASTAVNTRAFLESGAGNLYCEAELSSHVPPGQCYLVFRASDDLNYWRLGLNATELKLQKVVAGVATDLNNTEAAAALGDGVIRMGAVCNGNDITIMLNGRKARTITDAFNSGATKVGIQAQNTVSRLDNLFARSLVGGA